MQGRSETAGCDETGNRQSQEYQGTARGRSCSDLMCIYPHELACAATTPEPEALLTGCTRAQTARITVWIL